MQEVDIQNVIDIAKEAGDAIMELYNDSDLDVHMKVAEGDGNISPVTKADIASHKIIVSRLEELSDDVPVVSEEQDVSLNLEAIKKPRYWIIDPIDGTKGFIKKDGEFTVNIALIEGTVPTLGVVYAPAIETMYFTKDGAAWRTENSQTEQIHASDNEKVMSVVASKSHMDEATQKFIEQFGDVELVQAGSSLKICRVAEGEADVYPRLMPTTMEWDTAAADAVLRAAGGTMIDPDGNILAYGKLPELRNQGFVAYAPNVKFEL